jgi:hypothetical protein
MPRQESNLRHRLRKRAERRRALVPAVGLVSFGKEIVNLADLSSVEQVSVLIPQPR